jgi:hypothetical protein
MNPQTFGGNNTLQTRNRSSHVSHNSGLCTQCLDSCTGNCEVFKSSLRGREAICPGPLGRLAAGCDKNHSVDYSYLNILSSAPGAKAIDKTGTDKATVPEVDTSAVFGHTHPVRMRMPIFAGATGSADIAQSHWDALAAGAAICGISLVIGENTCAIDPGLQRSDRGRIIDAPEMKRRIGIYRSWKDEFGDVVVQINVEDIRLGVAEYAVDKLGVETVELKWGQGAKCIGGEIKVCNLDRAIELCKRGNMVMPNPCDPAIQAAFNSGSIREFECRSRMGFVDEEGFLQTVEYLRGTLGVKRVLLKIGSYGARDLAVALRWASKARLDLLTIDGSCGGTGNMPWPAMEERGIPTFYLQSMACDFAKKLAGRGEWMPDLAMAGGFSTESHIFKALAMGAPYFRAVSMGRALMIPGFVGDNIEGVLRNSRPTKWKQLPNTVTAYGDRPEQIFVTYETLSKRLGRDAMARLPLGAVAMYTYVDKLRTGLSRIMAGTRSFRLETIKRANLISLTEQAAKVSGIPYIMDAGMDDAEKMICS